MHAADEKIEWESYLGFLLDHDLDSAFEPEPINRTLPENKSSIAPVAVRSGQNVRAAPAAPPPPAAPMRPQFELNALKAESKQRAQAARTLEELYAEWDNFKTLPLRNEGGRQLVKPTGVAEPHLLIIGDAPDEIEDQTGEAFSGKPGQLIRRAVRAAGLSEHALFTPCVPFRPAGGRPLSADDVALNAPYLHMLIRLSAPRAIWLLGAAAVSLTLNVEGPLGKVRGRMLSYTGEDGQSIPAMVSFAPGFLLQNPAAKGALWADLLNLVADLPQN